MCADKASPPPPLETVTSASAINTEIGVSVVGELSSASSDVIMRRSTDEPRFRLRMRSTTAAISTGVSKIDAVTCSSWILVFLFLLAAAVSICESISSDGGEQLNY